LGDAIGRPCAFRYGALTLCGPVFNPVPLTHGFLQLPAGPSEPAHAIPQHPARNPRRVSHAQGLAIIRFRSPLLTEYPFLQVLRCFTSLRTPRPKPVPTHDGRWVPPFGNPRIKALLAAPRGISQPQTSFIGPVCQGIHHTPLQATHTTKVHGRKIPLANSQTTNHHTKKMITKRSKRTIEFDSKSTAKQRFKNPCFARVHYPVLKPPRTATPSRRHTAGPQARRASNRARQKAWGGDPGAQKRIHTTPHPPHDRQGKANDVFHTSNPAAIAPCDARGAHRRTNIRLNSP
jgi:hypothetical protein